MTQNSPYIADFLEQQIDSLVSYAREQGRLVPDRDLAASVILESIPRHWNDIARKAKVGLYTEAKISRSMRAFTQSGTEYGSCQIPRSVAQRTKAIESMKLRDSNHGDSSQLASAITDWPGLAIKPHKEQGKCNGRTNVLWVQELSFVASNSVRWNIVPAMAWRMRLEVLLPIAKNGDNAKDLVPEVRIEVIDQISLADRETTVEVISGVVRELAERVCTQAAWQLTAAAEELEHYLDDRHQWPMRLVFAVPDGQHDLAAAIFGLCNETSHRYGWMSFLGDLKDQQVDLMYLASIETSNLVRPTEKPPTSPARKALDAPETPGEVFLLMEFGLSGLTLCVDGMVESSIRQERYAAFVKETGEKPEDVLRAAGIDIPRVRKLSTYESVMSIVQRGASRIDWEAEDIKTAVWLAGVQKAQAKQPVVRLLVDLATGVQSASIGDGKESIRSFLERETAAGARLGVAPKAIKVSGTLLSAHESISAWAKKHGVDLVRPKSGADAGAKYVRLWNQIGKAVLTVSCPTEWWKSARLELNAWLSGCMDALDFAYAPNSDASREDSRKRIFMPESLFLSSEKLALFQRWKDSH